MTWESVVDPSPVAQPQVPQMGRLEDQRVNSYPYPSLSATTQGVKFTGLGHSSLHETGIRAFAVMVSLLLALSHLPAQVGDDG